MAHRVAIAPELETRPRVPSARNEIGSAPAPSLFEAGSHTRRTVGWRAPTASPNHAILASLTTLRDRSRAAVRNDGYAKGAIDKLVSNVVGTGIKPLSQAPNEKVRVAIHELWLRWTDEADADGMLDFYGLQSQAVRTWLEGGESFTRLRPRQPLDGLSVPLQLQVLEPELCPHTHTIAPSRVRAGVEFSAVGRRLAYYFHPSRPDLDEDYDASQLRRVPVDNVVHLYDPLRPGQLRGLPVLTPALVALNELAKFSDAVLLRQQLANMFTAFLTRDAMAVGEELHPLTGEVVERTDDDKPMMSLEPGAFQELGPGEEVKFSDPPKPDGYLDFMRQTLRDATTAAGVPYEVVTGDMRDVNDRTVRVILHEFRRRIQAWQHQIVTFQLNRRVWRAWMYAAWFAGSLPLPADFITNPEPWLAVKWIPQGWPYLHPVQDVQAAKDAVRDGFRSRSAVVSEQGEDAEVIDAEQAADNARADKLGLRYDSDGRRASSGAAAPPQADDTEQAGAQPEGNAR